MGSTKRESVSQPGRLNVKQQQRIRKHPRSQQDHGMVTRSATLAASRSAVLGTAELLEQILAGVPMRDLLRFRLVSKSWHKLIMTSPTLQTKLFLRPVKRAQAWMLDSQTAVLRSYIDGEEFTLREEFGKDWYKRQYKCISATPNPLFFKRESACINGQRSVRQRFFVAETLTFTTCPRVKSKALSVCGPVGDMFLTQPPAKNIEAYIAFIQPGRNFSWHKPLVKGVRMLAQNEGGVTWRDFVGAFERAAGPNVGTVKIRRARCRVWATKRIFFNATELAAMIDE